jgi:hypothetical protein
LSKDVTVFEEYKGLILLYFVWFALFQIKVKKNLNKRDLVWDFI